MSQVPPAVSPSEEQLRSTLQEVLSRSDYQTGTPSEPSEGMLYLLATLMRWVLAPFRWIFEMTAGMPEFLRWVIVIGLSVVLVAVFVHMGWTLIQAMTGGRRTQRSVALPSDMAHTELSVAELEQAAEQAVGQGELIEAVRYLFRATLTSLSEREKRRFRRGMTNRQYLRHYRDTSLSTPLQVFVSTIELKWYGDEPCDNRDYDHCRLAYQEIATLIRGGFHLNAS
jgi:hypothetical protein